MNNSYEDIINLKHYEPKNHPRMAIKDRAAQFSPFSALTGHKEAIKETIRLTNRKKILSEEEKAELNDKLQYINSCDSVIAIFTYFIKDLKKAGGKYIKIKGKMRKIDLFNQVIVLQDKTKIPINDIIDIELE